jgi:ornithine carbamoyltransferase
VQELLDLSINIKNDPNHFSSACRGKTLAMIFEKKSTRTRVSFEVGIFQLGGVALYLNPNDLQLGRGETTADTAQVLSRYVDGIMARTYAHQTVLDLAKYGTVPVINGLTDYNHPCQGLTDFFTIQEVFGKTQGIHLAYLGDGNNMAHSLMMGASRVGIDMTVITPKGYEPLKSVIEFSQKEAQKAGTKLTVSNDIMAAQGAHIIYTDVWASMGMEKEEEERKKIFSPYQVNARVMELADKSARFMHCLPAHRGNEVAAEVMDSSRSIVFDQAENRLHCQKAIMVRLMGN